MIYITIVFLLILTGMVFYVRFLLKKLTYISDNIDILLDDLSDYNDHLEKVYTSPVFYGDSTLQELLKHSQEVTKGVDEFAFVFVHTQDEENIDGTSAREED